MAEIVEVKAIISGMLHQDLWQPGCGDSEFSHSENIKILFLGLVVPSQLGQIPSSCPEAKRDGSEDAQKSFPAFLPIILPVQKCGKYSHLM